MSIVWLCAVMFVSLITSRGQKRHVVTRENPKKTLPGCMGLCSWVPTMIYSAHGALSYSSLELLWLPPLLFPYRPFADRAACSIVTAPLSHTSALWCAAHTLHWLSQSAPCPPETNAHRQHRPMYAHSFAALLPMMPKVHPTRTQHLGRCISISRRRTWNV
jgi:hypothetical protein